MKPLKRKQKHNQEKIQDEKTANEEKIRTIKNYNLI